MSGVSALLEADEKMVRSLATRSETGGNHELPAALACDLEMPETYAQAYARPHGRIWEAGERRVLPNLQRRGRLNRRGRNSKPKLVARGFAQREGVDFFDLFSPRARQLPVSACWLRLRVS